ncbi:hypothetical protein [Wenzhouxiangella sp. XN24]|uniref:hypothetical protein n=1 Tax=Wenzhouxiangella sp. XN24 TaxID=2713569 RepID=UPI0013ED1734|nr:hypothetical protein [Wenzhouxiangella sp. XN24]NGX16865.1 hypothetical protein [Wenzhouxiangella sp. XN24]
MNQVRHRIGMLCSHAEQYYACPTWLFSERSMSTRTSKIGGGPYPVDAHVHLHRPGLVRAVLDAAAANFTRARPSGAGPLGYLLLTQASCERVFETLAPEATLGRWRLEAVTAEPESFLARDGERTLVLVCGRQLRAEDGLEVAALGTTETFPDGLRFDESLGAVLRSGAVAAVPWGLGKWLGARGRRVSMAMGNDGLRGWFLGDSGSRCWIGAEPRLIRVGRAEGARVLVGTDPFPFGGDYRRVGSFGFLADLELNIDRPWGSLRQWLLGLPESPPVYGHPSGPLRFLVNQVGVHLYNRLRAREPA